MPYRKATLRRMSPVARKIARLIGELDSVATRLKNLIPELEQLELDSRALTNANKSLLARLDGTGESPELEL